jgi:hypothetical protein
MNTIVKIHFLEKEKCFFLTVMGLPVFEEMSGEAQDAGG